MMLVFVHRTSQADRHLAITAIDFQEFISMLLTGDLISGIEIRFLVFLHRNQDMTAQSFHLEMLELAIIT
jgi:hypothetical protein